MKNSGERVIPERYREDRQSYLIYLFHLATYRFSLPYVRQRNVLDFGCGTGYGTGLIADACRSVTGVDISREAITYAIEHNAAPNVAFQTIRKVEEERLPFPDNHFDTVLSFQVIEHVVDAQAYVDEAFRVLKPKGTIIMATPDRTTRLFRNQKPWNIFHVLEYDQTGLETLLASRFRNIDSYTMSGSRQVIDSEISRTKRLRWVTFPFTFPGAAEWMRMAGLGLLRTLNHRGPGQPQDASDFGFDENDIQIGKGLTPSVNLVTVAKKMA